MTLPTTITVIGAGSASFGENTLAALLRSPRLRGSTLPWWTERHSLGIVQRLADRLNGEWHAGFPISAHTHHREALPGAEFVVTAIEVGPREELWRKILRSRLNTACASPMRRTAARAGLPMPRATIEAGPGNRPGYGTGLPRGVVYQLHQPDGAHLRPGQPPQPHQVCGSVPSTSGGYYFAGVALGRDLGIQVPAASPACTPIRWKMICAPVLCARRCR